MVCKDFFLQFVTLPWTPRGRRLRIRHLMRSHGYERDVCAAVVFLRDIQLGRNLSEEETMDYRRIVGKVLRKELILPADAPQYARRIT